MPTLLVNDTDIIHVQCCTGQQSDMAVGTILLRTEYTVSCSFEISIFTFTNALWQSF